MIAKYTKIHVCTFKGILQYVSLQFSLYSFIAVHHLLSSSNYSFIQDQTHKLFEIVYVNFMSGITLHTLTPSFPTCWFILVPVPHPSSSSRSPGDLIGPELSSILLEALPNSRPRYSFSKHCFIRMEVWPLLVKQLKLTVPIVVLKGHLYVFVTLA